MHFRPQSYNYYHILCYNTVNRNHRKIKKYLDPAVPFKRFQSKTIGKCGRCKGHDLKEIFGFSKRFHIECNNTNYRNYSKMKDLKTDTCAFTGLPFGPEAEMKPVGDHDHDTLLYRGHIWSAANRLEGAAKFIMDEAGWTVDELCDALKSYLAKPGIDIGLEPYPQLGFSTPEEAQQHYGC